MRFYFFKVTLSYFDDEKKTFFITPDQSEADDIGVPFSENGLQNTPEFREFVKKTKADVIDVDYTEYAVEYEPKKSDILNKPVTSESFAELEKSGQYEIVDQNQFLLVLKKQKKSSSGSNKSYVVCLMIAAVIVLGVLAYGALNKRNTENVTSNISAGSEVSEISSNDVSGNSGEDEISDTGSEESSSALDESSANSSTNSENTHEVTSDSSSSGSTNNESGSDSSDDTSTSSAETASNSNTAISDIFNNDSPSNMAVTIYYDIEEPSVYFIDPNGNVNLGSSYTVDHGDKSVCYYIPNAIAGQWAMGCDQKNNTALNVNWSPYGDQPQNEV